MRISDPTSSQDKKKKYNQTNSQIKGELMPEANQLSMAVSKTVGNIGDDNDNSQGKAKR
jgi:hypothetical protein